MCVLSLSCQLWETGGGKGPYILLVIKRDKVKFSVVRVHECERVLMCFLFKVLT